MKDNHFDYTFSVIIPHHDIPKLLKRCVDSIPERDDLQIIVIDDNSKDGDRYLELYPFLNRKNLEYIPTHEGRGAGYARNVGLDHARGKWLLFADADDFFTYCLDEMLDKYKDCEADVVFFNVNSCDSDFYISSFKRTFEHNEVISLYNTNKAASEYKLRYILGQPWCKLIRRDMVVQHSIRFDQTPQFNDTTFSYLVGYYAKTIAIDEHAIYTVTFRMDSITYSKRTPAKRLGCIDVYARRHQFFKDHGIKDGWIYATDLYLLSQMISSGEWELVKEGFAIVRKYNKSDFNIYIGLSWQLLIRICNRLRRDITSLSRRLTSNYPPPCKEYLTLLVAATQGNTASLEHLQIYAGRKEAA